MATNHNGSHGHGAGHGGHSDGHGHHFVLPTGTAWKIFGSLIALTIITVALSYVHLGPLNYIIGMLVATIKASLVIWFFMTLGFDKKSNLIIFLTGFFFIAIFFGLTFPDLFHRGDVYVKGPLLKESAGAGAKFKKPWEPQPELVAHGKAVFEQQCVSCHGAAGKGDGPAAAALNPHPRDFTAEAGWKNGRKPSQIFKTLKEGIPGSGMASFGTLPQADRWALSHFVATLGPNVLKDSNADLTAVGVDPNSETGGAAEAKVIPISTAIRLMSEGSKKGANVAPSNDPALQDYDARLNSDTFSKQPIKAQGAQ